MSYFDVGLPQQVGSAPRAGRIPRREVPRSRPATVAAAAIRPRLRRIQAAARRGQGSRVCGSGKSSATAWRSAAS